MDRVDELLKDVRAKRILFAFPAYEAKVGTDFLESWTLTMKLLETYKIKYSFAIRAGDCYIAKARNELVTTALQENFTHIFFIDADLGWEPEGVCKVIARNEDIVVGAYTLKSDTKKTFSIDPKNYFNGLPFTVDGVVQVVAAATGFMCISIDLINRMIKAYPSIEYDNQYGSKSYNLFHCDLEDYPTGRREWVGEDINFCRKANTLGASMVCVPNIKLKHAGIKVWEGRLSDHIT